MKRRCLNKTDRRYKHYGARGIQVCERWQNSFEAFLEDMGPRPSSAHSIDRIDVNGNYEPGNCRWTDNVTQQRNKTNNRLLTYRGRTLCLTQWAEEMGIWHQTLQHRLAVGWSVERALTQPLRKDAAERQRARRAEHGSNINSEPRFGLNRNTERKRR